MDPRLLDYYNRELAFIREMGQEFAQEHPKIAGRLGMKGMEVADPYVERLLEGFALLSGRIQLKMDAEFPRFSQRLLELIYPHYLAPTPAMGVVKMHPAELDGGISEAFVIPRHTLLRAPLSPGQVTACQFRTAHAVDILPIGIERAWVEGPGPFMPTPHDPPGRPASSLHLKLTTHDGRELRSLAFDAIPFYISAPFDRAMQLLELVCGRCVGVSVKWHAEGVAHQEWLPAECVAGMGFSADEALIPYGERSFSGYRLLHEYFACPDRFRFFKVSGLRRVLSQVTSTIFELAIHFDRECSELEKVISQEHFHLFCTPVINLFPKKGDRVAISMASSEYHLVGDRTRPLDFEVYSVSNIHGYTADNTEIQPFYPIYESPSVAGEARSESYFSTRREPRRLSSVARHRGPRTGYIGSEVFVQIVDRQHAPYTPRLARIAPEMLCTNRDLPMLLTSSAERNFQLSISAPVERVELISTLSRPSPSMAERKSTWRLISHLQLNFHTLTDASPTAGANVMRELLNLYAMLSHGEASQHVDAVTSMQLKPVYARIPQSGPIVFGRGVDIHVEVDQVKFAGASPWLFGAVLERFFARHTGINTATRLRMSTLQGGAFATWPMRLGTRPQA